MQKGIDGAVGQRFGNEAAGHDGAFVHIERHALQPGFAGEVGRRLAGADAFGNQGLYGVALGLRGSRQGRVVQVGVERQVQAPQGEPGCFVESIGCAMPQAHVGILQALGLGLHEPVQGRRKG